MKTHLLLILISMSQFTIHKSKVTGYYFGKNDWGSKDMMLNEDSTFCIMYSAFEDPCHRSGHASGKWVMKGDTIILVNENIIPFLDGTNYELPSDTFLWRKNKMLQIKLGGNPSFLGTKFKRSRYVMDCDSFHQGY